MKGSSSDGVAYEDQPSRSPWIAQFAADGPPRPLGGDARTDVVIVGAGIAGIATAFFTLRGTTKRVLVVERDRVGRGATGRNAGQLTTYFERPLCDIADEFGVELAAEAQGGLDDAHDLLDLMVAENLLDLMVAEAQPLFGWSGSPVTWACSTCTTRWCTCGAIWSGGKVSCAKRGVWSPTRPTSCRRSPQSSPACTASSPRRGSGSCWRPATTGTEPFSPTARGASTAASSVQQVLTYLERSYPERFRFVDHTDVDRVIVSDDRVVVHARGHTVESSDVVLCTNGFVDHVVVDKVGEPIQLASAAGDRPSRVHDRLRRPAAHSRSNELHPQHHHRRRHCIRLRHPAHVRPSRRHSHPHLHGWTPSTRSTAVSTTQTAHFPGTLLGAMDEQVRPFAQPAADHRASPTTSSGMG